MWLEAATLARSITRKAGLTPALNRVRMLWHEREYEDKFAPALLNSIRPDDCVWDVGANTGFYTEQLARRARHVVAFEPISENMERLRARRLVNVRCVQAALGDTEGVVTMAINAQYSSIVESPYVPSNAARETVAVKIGDKLLSELPRPAILKIDVEGYEPEVIRGMQQVLCDVRGAFIEVHFAILERRGMRQAPAAIVRTLKKLGLTNIKWVDASHIAALREGDVCLSSRHSNLRRD